MSSSGAPGTAPHPSLPARPPVSASASTASTAHNSANSSATGTPTMPPTSATPTPSASLAAANGSSYGPSQPRLGYSRTYAGNTNNSAPAAAAPSTYTSYYNNSKYPQQTPAQGASYGPTAPTGYRPPYGQQQQQPQAQTSYSPQAPTSYGPQAPASYGPQAPTSYGPQAPTSYGPQTPSYGQAASAAPHIRNPFSQQPPQPQQNGRGGNYRQNNTSWQSGGQQGAGAGAAAAGYQNGQYNNAQYGPYYGQQQQQQQQQQQYPGYGPSYPEDPAAAAAAVAAAAAGAAEAANTDASGEKKQTVYRSGGGKQWADDSLLEWDPSHLRLFVGNLAGEVTDETLLKAFSKWKSVQKALVKRDKWTKKSRGYGFVSFSDPDDFFQAAKEMNGKYIGSHPVVVRKSKTEIKVSSFKDDSRGRKKNNKNKNKQDGTGAGAGVSGSAGSGVGGTAPRRDEAALRAMPSGVHKPGKTKNGLKLLG